jgi:hypothetical protein
VFTIAIVGVLVGMLGACGGGGGGASGGTTATGGTGTSNGFGGSNSTGNKPPSISGNPPSAILQGTEYVFVPKVSDPDGDRLTFWVTGLPSWASFSSSTGRIKGTPDLGDLGSITGIRIGVTDGAANVYLSPFSIDVVATALGSATLSWESPTQRADGSPLMNLAGFKIYWGMDPDGLSNSMTIANPGLTSFMIEQLVPAKWYFVATAFDTEGLESSFSNIASKMIL